MAIKMTVCSICRKEVTKASTLSLKELGGGEGRACRSHDEVKALVEKQKQEWINKRNIQWAERIIRLGLAVAAVRFFHTIHNVPLELIYFRLSRMHSPEDIAEIKKEVEIRGAVMSDKEIRESLAAVKLFNKQASSELPEF